MDFHFGLDFDCDFGRSLGCGNEVQSNTDGERRPASPYVHLNSR